jgi:hypothetical protein
MSRALLLAALAQFEKRREPLAFALAAAAGILWFML